MSGDYSRDGFDALRDFAGVFLQQGRAVLDSDWNGMVRVFERRIRAECVDTIGRAVVPRETINGFRIRITGDGGLEIGRGRHYLDGLLLECRGLADFAAVQDDDSPPLPVFDRARPGEDAASSPVGVLDEPISPPEGDFLPYDAQPYWPTPEPLPTPGPADNVIPAHLVYLVAWQRELTAVQDATLLEPALNGIDTTTRWQSVWQVRVLADVGDNANCASADEDLEDWVETMAPSTARLTTDTVPVDDPENPCLVPPTDGYTGTENQLYRVELHLVGDAQGDARFKYSRENASVVAAIEAIADPADRVTVNRVGRDDVLAFHPGDWVEVTDDHRELDHRSGRMLRVAVVHPETREIEFDEAIDAPGAGADDLIPSGIEDDTLAARHSRLIRWDQHGEVRLTDGTLIADLDHEDSDGLIPVPDDDTPVVLESGITVSFSTAPGPGGFRAMDYWCFAARTVGTQLERRVQAPPDGIQRHHTRLAVVRLQSASVLDCRTFWPPDFGGGEVVERCGCTVCVSAEGHNAGELTIQAAIDQLPAGGGTVCLGPGTYLLGTPVSVAGRNAVRVLGQGIGTVLIYAGAGAALRLAGGFDISLEGFSLLVRAGATDAAGNLVTSHGITAVNTGLMALRRLAVLVADGGTGALANHGIALDGIALGNTIAECVVAAPVALGSRSSQDAAAEEVDDPTFVALAELRAEDNILLGGREAVRFDRVALNIADAVFARNLVIGGTTGIRINWADIPTGATLIQDGTVQASGTALVIGASDLRLSDCEISGGADGGDGLRLTPNILPDLATDARIIGNSLFDLGGTGIRIAGNHGALMIKQNILRRCAEAGIATLPEARVRDLAIDNNLLEEIAPATGIQDAGGIVLTGVASGRVSGNTLRGVGQGGLGQQVWAGIAVQGVGAVTVSENALYDIGPDLPDGVAAAILAERPYGELRVSGNRVQGSTTASAIAAWSAIRIGSPPRDDDPIGGEAPPDGFVGALPGAAAGDLGYASVDDTWYSLSPAALYATTLGPRSRIEVSSNQAQAAAFLSQPMVLVFDSRATMLGFGQNQVTLQGNGQIEVVLLGARRITVSANTVVHQGDRLSMRLITGGNGAATPIGNITSAGIDLAPGGLPAAFAALNLIA